MHFLRPLIILLFFVIPVRGQSFSFSDSTTTPSYAREVVNNLESNIAAWQTGFEAVALSLFGMLVLLDFIWTLVHNLVLKGATIILCLQTLVEKALFYGISYLVITEGPTLCLHIVQGFHEIAIAQSPGNFNEGALITSISILSAIAVVVAVLGTALSCFWVIFFPITFEPLWAQITILLVMFVIGVFASGVIQSVILYIELLIMLALSPIIFALGGLKMTSAASIGFIKQSIGVGVQLVALVCILEALAEVLITLLTSVVQLNFMGLTKAAFAVYLLAACIKTIPASLANLAIGVAGSFASVNASGILKNMRGDLSKIKGHAKENRTRKEANRRGVTPAQFRREKALQMDADPNNRGKSTQSMAARAAVELNTARGSRGLLGIAGINRRPGY